MLTVSEVVTIAPKYVFVFIGTNDAYGAVSTVTYAANIASYVSALTSVGYVVGTNIFFISALPRNGVNVVPYNDVLKANYPTAYIDAYYSFEDPAHLTYLNPKYDSGDQVHLNSQGHIDLANIIETAKMSIFTKKRYCRTSKNGFDIYKKLFYAFKYAKSVHVTIWFWCVSWGLKYKLFQTNRKLGEYKLYK